MLGKPTVSFDEPLAFLHPLRGRVGPVRTTRAQLVPPLQSSESLKELPLLPEGEAQVAVGLGIIGLQLDGLVEGGERLVKPALAEECVAEMAVRRRIVGSQGDSLAEGCDRLVALAMLPKRAAQVEVHRGT